MRPLLTTLALALICSWSTAVAAPKNDKDLRSVVDGSLGFAHGLYRQLRSGRTNLFFSPASISTAMAMTHGGARRGTAREMARVMGFRLPRKRLHAAYKRLLAGLRAADRKGGTQLSVANALWGQRGHPFHKTYLDLVRRSYGGGLEQVDFKKQAEEARETINSWVSNKTRGKIDDIIPEGLLNEMTRLVLTNAVYFKGKWKVQFSKSNTQDMPFRLTRRTRVKAPLMHLTDSFRYRGTRAFQVLELPYKGSGVSMVILLPRRVGQLRAVEPYLHPRRLRRLLRSMPRREVEVYLPRFQIESSVELTARLRAMGLRSAFSAKADFSGMDGTRLLFLRAVLHEAWVEVNEEGTEAAAATGIMGEEMEGESNPEPPVFKADRPFLFLIRERKTGCVLFVGRLMDPTNGSGKAMPTGGKPPAKEKGWRPKTMD